MIRIDRSGVTPPTTWLSRSAEATERLEAVLSAGKEPKFDDAILLDVRPSLSSLFRAKCAYCESLPGDFGGTRVDRFRPKARVVDLDGTTSRPGYWWLAYAWENLYLACAYCNRNKGSRFPVTGRRARSPRARLATERALLLDPCHEDVEAHLLFDRGGKVASRSPQTRGVDRGQITIDILGLNRPDLVEARHRAALELEQRFRRVAARRLKGKRAPADPARAGDVFADLVDLDRPYVALQRQCLAELVNQYAADELGDAAHREALRRSQDTKEELLVWQEAHEEDLRRSSVADNPDRESLQSQKIDAVEIVNFRGIDRLRFRFGAGTADEAGWTMLLGENGVGKSSVLQALALALAGHSETMRLPEIAAADLLRKGEKTGHIRVEFAADAEPIEVRLTPREIDFGESAARPRMILLAFGSSRWLPRPGGFDPESGEFIRIRNLFNPFVPLADTLHWLRTIKPPEFKRTEAALLRLLGMEDKRLIRARGDVLVAPVGGSTRTAVPLRSHSDGYQSIIAMVGDVMELLSPKRIDMDLAEGLVLIDEIGAHLHPRWQMQAVRRLRRAFPHLQALVTTHDPLCLRGMHDDEILVLRRDSHDRVVAIDELPPVEALRVDQLLMSPHFGLHSTVDEDVEERFQEYYDLLALPRHTKRQGERVEELRGELDTGGVLGANPREQAMLEAIDTHLARQADALSEGKEEKLKQKTQDALASILEELDAEGERRYG